MNEQECMEKMNYLSILDAMACATDEEEVEIVSAVRGYRLTELGILVERIITRVAVRTFGGEE